MPSAGTVEHEGNTIGFCCPGCDETFLVWDEERKDAFVTLATADREQTQDDAATHNEPAATGAASPGLSYPYTLPDCPVGVPLGSMGEPVELVAGTKLVRLCCGCCVPKFKENPWNSLSKLPRSSSASIQSPTERGTIWPLQSRPTRSAA